MSMCRVIFCYWKRVFAMTSVFSWKNSVSVCPASLCAPRPNLPVTPGVSCLPTFTSQIPVKKRTSFFLVLVLEGLLGLHRAIQHQLLWHQWLGIDLDYCDAEWFVLETNRSFCHFRDCTQVLHFGLLLTMKVAPFFFFFLWDSCTQ